MRIAADFPQSYCNGCIERVAAMLSVDKFRIRR